MAIGGMAVASDFRIFIDAATLKPNFGLENCTYNKKDFRIFIDAATLKRGVGEAEAACGGAISASL